MRTRIDRNHFLDLNQVRDLTNAFAFAAATRKPLNALLTVTWGFSHQFHEPVWANFQTALLWEAGRWLKRRGILSALAWTRERVSKVGVHTHAGIYLGPRPLSVRDGLIEFLSTKYDFAPGGIDISFGRYGAYTEQMRAGILRYIAKGFDHSAFRYTGFADEREELGTALGLRDLGHQGRIEIKREGASQNITRTARRRSGWAEIRTLDALHRAVNPPRMDWVARYEWTR